MSENKEKNNTLVRPPVVVILGHVDHGKTSILDTVRKSRVAAREAGGITQHIGAYQAEFKDKIITFLDTPGHEAFSAIRSRGAKVADIAILVVAADEGIKPQTKEAITIIQEAKIPFVVAVNKIDKEGANPQKVRQELAEQSVLVEDYGGNVPIVELSAKTGQGIDNLLDMILLVAELEELSYNPDSPATGVVIESHLDHRRGMVATLLVHNGELKLSDWIYAGEAVGKIKTMEDFTGKSIKSASASQPCVVIGWENLPRVGREFTVVKDRSEASAKAQEIATTDNRPLFEREEKPNIATVDQGSPLLNSTTANQRKVANLIIKADVQSSLEAIDQVLHTIHSEEVDYKVITFGVGNINDADVKSAIASKSTIIGFHVSIDSSVKQMAERENIRVITFDIIYELVETVRSILSDLLEPEIKRTPLGKMKVLALFKNGDAGNRIQIIGGKVTQGKAVRGAMIDITKKDGVITGRLAQLQKDKKDVTEVAEGSECGIRFEMIKTVETGVRKLNPIIAVGDSLEIYEEEKIKRSL